MTRKEAKDIINKIRYEYTFNCSKNSLKVVRALGMAIDALSEPYWIPISGGLPNEQESVNVTVVDDHGDNEWRYTTTAWRINDIWISNDEVVTGTVVAWAPLPKPYERNKL